MKNHQAPMEPSTPKQQNIFGSVLGRRKLGEVCIGGPSGIFRQNSIEAEKSGRPGALSSYARAARQSIGGISHLITRRLTSGSPPPALPWPIRKEDYDLNEVIGFGATAVVHSAFCKTREEKCAIKKINLEKWNTSMDELLNEIKAMSNCNHENVVTYYTSFVVNEELWLVLKLLEGGSLLDVIKRKIKVGDSKHGVFDEAVIATVLKEVLKGLDYFHTNGQIHRDIKAGNILLGVDGEVQIADFGVSAWLATGRDMSRPRIRHTFVGTPCWMAPEVMEQDHGYDFKADIWSFGITAIEMAIGTAPYHKYPAMKVLMLTLQCDPPTLDSGAEDKEQYKNYGKSFRKMIHDCLQKDPKKRPTAGELLQHTFFKKAKDKRFLAQQFAPLTIKPKAHKAPKRVVTPLNVTNSVVPAEWLFSDDEDDDELVGDVAPGEDAPGENRVDASANGVEDSDTLQKTTEKNYVEPNSLYFVLRIRNKMRQLDDIRFEFIPGKDAANGIATELETAGLIDPRDVDVVARNLNELIHKSSPHRLNSVVFQLNSLSPYDTFNDKVLLGYAQLSLIEGA